MGVLYNVIPAKLVCLFDYHYSSMCLKECSLTILADSQVLTILVVCSQRPDVCEMMSQRHERGSHGFKEHCEDIWGDLSHTPLRFTLFLGLPLSMPVSAIFVVAIHLLNFCKSHNFCFFSLRSDSVIIILSFSSLSSFFDCFASQESTRMRF